MKKTTKRARTKRPPPPKTVLVLRTVDKDRKAYDGFVWPETGPVEAPDWGPTKECGHGLHGFRKGEGDGTLANWNADALWQVVEVVESDIIELDGKVKFPRGVVLYTGTRLEATKRIQEAHPSAVVIGGTAAAGDRGTATAGYGGTAAAGDRGTATAGYGGTATAGASGTATAGHYGTATAGYGGTAAAGDRGTAAAGDRGTATAGASGAASAGDAGTATAGDSGTATAGHGGTATAGDCGTATAGASGTATAGHYGTATAGYGGTATAGDCGTATAGEGGAIVLRYWDEAASRYRLVVGYPGEDGIEAGKAYRLDANHKFVEVAPAGK